VLVLPEFVVYFFQRYATQF